MSASVGSSGESVPPLVATASPSSGRSSSGSSRRWRPGRHAAPTRSAASRTKSASSTASGGDSVARSAGSKGAAAPALAARRNPSITSRTTPTKPTKRSALARIERGGRGAVEGASTGAARSGARGVERLQQPRQHGVVAVGGAAVAVVVLLVLDGDLLALRGAREAARPVLEVVLVARPAVDEEVAQRAQRRRLARDALDWIEREPAREDRADRLAGPRVER